ncbi:MAG: 1-acyl-sn-glycerol-3-phosphate acyltransferase [Firmicutes bacterium]|nr:1-acyl-sn-glycerol-3-phosphate acyltransferase [Bacillota bacterium]
MSTPKSIWNLIEFVSKRAVAKRFDYSCEGFDFGTIEGPVFVVTNHVCAWDPFLVGLAFPDRQFAFVASEHVMRMPKYGKLIGKVMDIIPHRKAGGGTSSTRESLKRIKNGESIFIASEGEQTWDGKTKPVVKPTGKLIKKSGATLVTFRIDGGHLAMPRWADNARRGKVYAHHVNIYTPEELEEMTPEEVNAVINRDLAFDIWEWQREEEAASGTMNKYIPAKGGLADGIERMLYICPTCKRLGTLRSSGDYVDCECGFKTRFTETGFPDPEEPFETLAEWSDWQDDVLEEMLGVAGSDADGAAGDGMEADELFGDDGFVLIEIGNDHSEKTVANGRLSLGIGGVATANSGAEAERSAETDGAPGEVLYIEVGGTRFTLNDISQMAMILAKRIVFSASGMYYEIRPHDMKGRMNLRKYLVAWQKARSSLRDAEEE